jgi:predicted DNA-binding transcriptional regulator YafY
MATTTRASSGRSKAKGTAADITRYQMEIVRFLAEAGEPRTIEQIHDYLTEQHGLQRDYNTVRRWLKKMRDSKALVAESVAPLGDTGAGKPKAGDLVAESSPGLLMKELNAEEAWLLMLAQRVLEKIIPQDFFENSLSDVFQAARRALAGDRQMKMLADRIIYVPRGQRLYEAQDVGRARIEIVEEILKAIRDRKMLAFLYGEDNEERQVHPIALVYREPKLHLLALKEGRDTPTNYLCARMSEVSVLDDRPNCVPDNYPIKELEVDLSLHRDLGLPPDPVRLVLRIDANGRGNLIDDLQKYRLDPLQELVDLGGGQWELTISSVMITAQLMEWIAGRQGAVKVVEPSIRHSTAEVQ